MVDFPDTPLPPQPGDSSEVFSERAGNCIDFMVVAIPLVAAMQPFVDSMPTLEAAVNYAGVWSTLSGALTKGHTVHHNGLIYLALVDLANVAAVTPGTDATKWYTNRRASKRTVSRALTTTLDAFDIPLEPECERFDVMAESLRHNVADATRALIVSFSTDDITGSVEYGDPIVVTQLVDSSTDLDVDLTFYRSDISARSLRSSRLGELGHVVPAGATAMRIAVGLGSTFSGRITPGAVDGRVRVVGHWGNAT